MESITLDRILEQLRTALETGEFAAAEALINGLRAADQATLVGELDEAAQAAFIHRLDPADSADILEEMADHEAAGLAASLTVDVLTRIVEEMEPDEAADLLGDIHPDRARAVLGGLEDPDEVRPLLLHPDDTAGGLMTSEYVALRRRMTRARRWTSSAPSSRRPRTFTTSSWLTRLAAW